MALDLKAHKRALIIASVTAAVLLVGFFLTYFILRYTERADYINDDLSRYVTIDKSAYTGTRVEIKVAPVRDLDIEERKMRDLIAHRTSESLAYTFDGAVGVGDKIVISRYKVESEDGRVLAEGNGATPHTVGEAFKIYGYELAGMQAALVGCTVGENTLYAYLPHDYHEKNLATERVKITLNIEKFIDYDVPEITDAFIKDTLKLSDKLAAFDGNTLAEKYLAFISAELSSERENAVRVQKENAVWELISEKAEIKRLPSGDVRDMYDVYYAEILEAYNSYAQGTGLSIEEFGLAYVEADAGESLKAVLTHEAELAVGEKLTFYYILQNEGWLPVGDELSALYAAAVQRYLDAYIENDLTCRPEYFKNPADYEAKVKAHEEQLMKDYGEEYFYDVVYSEYGMEKLISVINFVNVAE